MYADVVLINGTVFGVFNPLITAVAVNHPFITALDTDQNIKPYIGPKTRVIDMKKRLLLPGFNDCHTHFLNFALSLDRLRLGAASSLVEVLHAIKTRIEKVKPGDWILGSGWEVNSWKENRFPNRFDLDSVAPDNPVALWSKDGHTLWLNSKAMKDLRIADFTADPTGGKIERFGDGGDPTGLLREFAADVAKRKIPRVSPDDVYSLMIRALTIAHEQGITGIHDFEGRSSFIAFQKLKNDHKLSLRILKYLEADEFHGALDIGLMSGFGNSVLKIGGVKLFADGALGSRTAHMLEPYEDDPTNSGMVVTNTTEMTNIAQKAMQAGLSVAIHAIGDAAVRSSLHALEKALSMLNNTQRLIACIPNRLEHVQLISEYDLPRLSKLKIVASVQPTHAVSDMVMADTLWGQERIRYAYAYKSMLQSKALMVFGSDCPVEFPNPVLMIHAATTRRRPNGFPGESGWNTAERISVLEAIKALTLTPATISGESHLRGSITEGKLADLVLLSQDVTHITPHDIKDVVVDLTLFDGQVVFERPGAL